MARVNVSVTVYFYLGCCECRHCQIASATERATDKNGLTQEERAREGVKWQLLEHKKRGGGA